jgi:hypothetical protein
MEINSSRLCAKGRLFIFIPRSNGNTRIDRSHFGPVLNKLEIRLNRSPGGVLPRIGYSVSMLGGTAARQAKRQVGRRVGESQLAGRRNQIIDTPESSRPESLRLKPQEPRPLKRYMHASGQAKLFRKRHEVANANGSSKTPIRQMTITLPLPTHPVVTSL